MRGASAARGVIGALVVVATGALLAPASSAVEALDGRVQVHGYYEAQIRSIVRDFDFSDDWDLTQWWNILSIEVEANVAPVATTTSAPITPRAAEAPLMFPLHACVGSSPAGSVPPN